MRIRNPYHQPVKIRTTIIGKSIINFTIIGTQRGPRAQITAKLLASNDPVEIVRVDSKLAPGQRKILTRGRPGMRVAVYRTLLYGEKKGEHELVSQDAYPAMNRVMLVGAKELENLE